jgi:hypothetical protein
MSLKHRLPELEASIDPAALRAAADGIFGSAFDFVLVHEDGRPHPGERARLLAS